MLEAIPKIEKIVAEVQSKFKNPAIAVAVVDRDQVLYARGFGTLSIHQDQAVDEHTLFALASISKSTAAAGLAILVDEGKLTWTDPVCWFLPDFAFYDPFVNHELQVRDLLFHNSGLPSVSGGTIWYDSQFDRKEVVQHLRYLKPVSSFRSTYAYQNVTYLVAGEIIKAITDTTWDDFVTQHIFEPLGMQRTTTKLSDLNRLQNYAIPHAWINGRIQSIPYRNHENVGAAAAVNSSVWDWAQYVQMFLNQGEYHGRTIISPQRVKELWTPQTIIPVEPLQPALQKLTPMLNAYGMGWFISDYCGHLIIAHSGGVDGMRTQMSIVPEKMMGFVIFTNIEPGYALSALYYSVLDQILGLEETPWSDIYAKIQTESFQKKADLLNERRQSRKENTTTSLALNHYCGDYHDPKTGLISVYQTGNKLRLSFEHSKCFHAELRHWHQDTFEIVWDDTYIPVGLLTFMINHDGIPDRIQLDQPNLLDVDFTELEIVRFHQKFGRQES